jgi:hypothetical protein
MPRHEWHSWRYSHRSNGCLDRCFGTSQEACSHGQYGNTECGRGGLIGRSICKTIHLKIHFVALQVSERPS